MMYVHHLYYGKTTSQRILSIADQCVCNSEVQPRSQLGKLIINRYQQTPNIATSVYVAQGVVTQSETR